jgi:hypothetical protein
MGSTCNIDRILRGGGIMGHAVNPDLEYRLLQRRLDCNITGAPESPLHENPETSVVS